MSASTTNTNGSEATGPGAILLAHTALQYILRTDPLLGSSDSSVPDGPFNRELAKLHSNNIWVADHFVSYTNRTNSVIGGNAPSAGTAVGTLSGATVTPINLQYHEAFYDDYAVLYFYDGTLGQWTEGARYTRVGSVVQQFTKTIVIVPASLTLETFAMPTTDDDAVATTWVENDIKSVHIFRTDGAAVVFGRVDNIYVAAGQINLQLVTDLVVGDLPDYEIRVIFHKIVIA